MRHTITGPIVILSAACVLALAGSIWLGTALLRSGVQVQATNPDPELEQIKKNLSSRTAVVGASDTEQLKLQAKTIEALQAMDASSTELMRTTNRLSGVAVFLAFVTVFFTIVQVVFAALSLPR